MRGFIASFTDNPISSTQQVRTEWSLGFITASDGALLLAEFASQAKVNGAIEFGVFVTSYLGDLLYHWTTEDGANLTAFLTPSELSDHLPSVASQSVI
jgi:hypothetical protein